MKAAQVAVSIGSQGGFSYYLAISIGRTWARAFDVAAAAAMDQVKAAEAAVSTDCESGLLVQFCRRLAEDIDE